MTIKKKMDYKNLGIRTISGAVLVALIVFAAIEKTGWAFFGIFGLISFSSIFEFVKINHGDKLHCWLYAFASLLLFLNSFAFIFVPFNFSDVNLSDIPIHETLLATWMIYMIILFLIELWLKAENPIHNWEMLALSQMYIAIPFVCMTLLKDMNLLLALFVLIWVNDTFAFLTGSYLGKHKMFERISPKKSWEGFIGGNIFALGAALVFAHYMTGYTILQWLIMGEIVIVFGTLGDLVESLMKRTLGIKDSGDTIPGHGGFLDRFDSAIVASVALTIFSIFLL